MLGICFLLSTNRRQINWKLVIGGIGLQLILAILILKVPIVYASFQWIADRFVDLLEFAEVGAAFVFGAWPDDAWIQESDISTSPPGKTAFNLGYMFAFRVLPVIVFFAAITSILYYFGILQRIVRGLAWVMSRFMLMSGAESVAAAANVFVGQTDAPLVVKPYLESMSRSEIMCLMTGGMATIAGSVFALFVSILGDEYAIHFLTASIISAPAAIVTAKIMVPETEPISASSKVELEKGSFGVNVLDAITIGTKDGVALAVNVGAILLVFLALVAMLNAILLWFGSTININAMILESTDGRFQGLSMEYILGLAFAPFAWLMGTPSSEIVEVGQLLGKKTVLNEVIGYLDLADLKNSDNALSPKSVIIATYALCGFANFASIGIQIGGISAIAPGIRQTLTQLGPRALVAGTIAGFMTAIFAGILAV